MLDFEEVWPSVLGALVHLEPLVRSSIDVEASASANSKVLSAKIFLRVQGGRQAWTKYGRLRRQSSKPQRLQELDALLPSSLGEQRVELRRLRRQEFRRWRAAVVPAEAGAKRKSAFQVSAFTDCNQNVIEDRGLWPALVREQCLATYTCATETSEV